jgi:hypothetical protein
VSVDIDQIHKDTKSGNVTKPYNAFHPDDSADVSDNDESDGACDLDNLRVKVKDLFSYVTKRHPDSFSSEFMVNKICLSVYILLLIFQM